MSTRRLFSELSEEEQFDVMTKTYPDSRIQSARYNQGKPQTNEIDPNFILGIAKVLTKSREKYERANWTRETKWSTPYDSCMRHIIAFQSGEDIDKESGQHHLLHAATNLMFLFYYTQNQPQNDDRVFKKESK